MRIKILSILVAVVGCLWFSSTGQAFVPLESLVLGDLSQILLERKSDPIQYVLRVEKEQDASMNAYTRFLAFYRGVYSEGENLKNYCPFAPKAIYARPIELDQVKRSVMATLQYLGLDLTSRAIALYAKQLEYGQDEWRNLADRLVGQYCSKNLTIISLKQLRKNLDVYFEHGASFELPSVENNPLFSKALSGKFQTEKSRELEFLQTVKLFRAVCTWGNESDNPRLLVPFLRNPIIMATVIRHFTDTEMAYNSIDNSVYLTSRKDSGVKVWCENLICRKRNSEYLQKKIFRSIGSKSVKGDLESLYCHSFRDLDFLNREQVPEIKKWTDTQSFDDFNFQQSQFLSLLTGVPDFLLRSTNFTTSQDMLRASFDQMWDEWAQGQVKTKSRDLYYEEPLAMELVDRGLYFNPFRPDFKVVFDVNLGELDRANRIVGKIKAKFHLEIHNTFLAWIRSEWNDLDPRNVRKRDSIVKNMIKSIEDQVQANRKNFILPPWDGNLENLIADEIIQQLSLYKGPFFSKSPTGIMRIPIEINYGPFALKYLAYEAQVKKESQAIDYSSYEYSD
ncbi:MAG: hypothetical protein A2X86_15010 [Bdellovibrionales bacterium GWA2_49_15]|nr:MAG: hypothetical protein A2X86_15010 [Bdellovibrionales bacterium GWA2_49_15]HAZ13347.1 hypothetical protein [Bdellovibrionales bacterium]